MTDGIHEFTATGRQKKASEELICSWISQAWKAIPSEMIAASFLKCGIINNSDGSQDELVYNSTEITDELNDSVIENLFESELASWNLKVSLFKDTKVYLNSSSQSHKGNDMNCCWVKKSSEFSYVAVLKTTKSLAITFSTHSNICQLWRISLRYPFPNICINSPVKAYFDYVRKPFQVVTINNICIIGPSCCTFSVGKIVAT